MRPDISEFSFGFALTSELVRAGNLRHLGAPTFPTTQAEAGLGYDVQLPGIPVFIQFKVSDHMTKRRAPVSYLLGVPHFRMHLRPLKHSTQHDELLKLEQQIGNLVLYATPEFSFPPDLSVYYATTRVVANTAFWKPSTIGPLPDLDEHYVAFRSGDPVGYFCTTNSPTPIRKASWLPRASGFQSNELSERYASAEPQEPIETEIRRRIEARDQPFDEAAMRNLSEALVNLVSEESGPERDRVIAAVRTAITERRPDEGLSFAAATLLGCRVLIAVSQ